MLLWSGFLLWWLRAAFRRNSEREPSNGVTFIALVFFGVVPYLIEIEFWLEAAFQSLFNSWRSSPTSYFLPSLGIPLVSLLLKGLHRAIRHRGWRYMRVNWRDVLLPALSTILILVPSYAWHLIVSYRDITNRALNVKTPAADVSEVGKPPGWENGWRPNLGSAFWRVHKKGSHPANSPHPPPREPPSCLIAEDSGCNFSEPE